ncbi:hypothetical protein D030_4111A, partial [Vibrio parahaemolyticus AQ3810]
MPSFG